MTMRPALVLLSLWLLSVCLLAGCGAREPRSNEQPTPTPVGASSTATPAEQAALAALGRYPARNGADFRWGDEIFHVLAEDGHVVDADPWTACLANGCWDGAPWIDGHVASMGSPDALYFAFDFPGWEFEHVTFGPVGQHCGGRSITVPATRIADRVFRVDPAGLAGEWWVDLGGRGHDGDAITTVHWTTTADGEMPEPTASGSLFFQHDDGPVTYGGPEVYLSDLAATPREVSGTWHVNDAAGHRVSVPLTRRRTPCAPDGSVSLRGRALTPEQRAQLDGQRFTYTVELRLDGRRYSATAPWPQRQLPGDTSTLFDMEPPLPAYRG